MTAGMTPPFWIVPFSISGSWIHVESCVVTNLFLIPFVVCFSSDRKMLITPELSSFGSPSQWFTRAFPMHCLWVQSSRLLPLLQLQSSTCTRFLVPKRFGAFSRTPRTYMLQLTGMVQIHGRKFISNLETTWSFTLCICCNAVDVSCVS